MNTSEEMREALKLLPEVRAAGVDALAQWSKKMDEDFDTLEDSARSLTNIIDSILQFLEIGRSVADRKAHSPMGVASLGAELVGDLLTEIVEEKLRLEERIGLSRGRGHVEMMVEVLPRANGGWILLQDAGPLRR